MVLRFFDIETTGFNYLKDDILQVGFITANENGKIVNAGNMYYYRPEFKVENPEAFAVHGITRARLEPYEQDFSKNVAALYTMLQKGYIIGKNSDKFDIPFCLGWLNKIYPGVLPTINLFRTCDVQKVMSPICKEKIGKTGTLSEYVELLQIKDFVTQMYEVAQKFARDPAREGFHDALYDSVATYCVWLICRQNNWVSL